MSRFARVRRLAPAQRRVLVTALALLPWVEAQLRWGGLRCALRSLQRVPMGVMPGNAAREAQIIARTVAAARRYGPWPARCLATALVLQRVLRKHGIESDLLIGVRREGSQLKAHAWIEHDGCSLMEEPGVRERFGALAALPGNAR